MNSCRVFPLAVALAMLALGCGGETASPSQTTSQTSSEFGVAECDAYVKKYLACIDTHVPEATRAMVRQSFDQTREQWRRAAATPEGKQGLAAACKQADTASQQAMQAYGCQW